MVQLRETYNSLYVRSIAKVISYIFHPLFIPTFIFLWLVIRFPSEFAGITERGLIFKSISVFWSTAFFPAFAVFLLWKLKLIQSIFLTTTKERIIPYVITMFFYWWLYYLSRNFTDQPLALKFFYLGIFLATVVGLILNNFMKISMHAMGVGGGIMFMIFTCLFYQHHLGGDLSIGVIITGLVCTARLLISDHTNAEIYSGLLTGIICQWAAYSFVV